MKELTSREQEVFDYICAFKKRDGNSPSIRDIYTDLGFKSTSSVHTILLRLEEKGYIERKSGVSRGLTVKNESFMSDGEKFNIPVIGDVAAGSPILASENHKYYMDFPKRDWDKLGSEMFALEVKGDSMILAGIMNGDIVIVEKRSVAENGEIIVALIDGEATVKRFFKENGHFRLQPENPTMEPIIVNELVVLGKVVSSVRYYR